MRVMVTGGAGYVGSVVCEALLRQKHTVLVLDNLSQGHRDAVPPEACFVQAELADEVTVRSALRSHGVQAVVHLAADSLVGESLTDPLKYYRNNVGAGLSLLGAMQSEGVTRMVFSSTAAVYGEARPRPIEEGDPTEPQTPYGESKLVLERALGWCERAFGLRSVSLRYFNAAGASGSLRERHHPETHLIPMVLEAARGLRPFVEVYGTDYPTRDGTCVRDYTHVADLARAHVMALDALVEGAPSRVYNLGCGEQGSSVGEVIRAAREVTGRAITTRDAPRRKGDPAMLVASSARIAQELGWLPEIQDLREIIRSAWKLMD